MGEAWTNLLRQKTLGVSTPLVAIDLEALRLSVREIAAKHSLHSMRWYPETAWAGVPAVTKTLREQYASGVSVGGLRQATAAVEAGAGNVTIRLPPVVAQQPARFADLCRSALMTVVCDHYAQAERVAEACRGGGVTANILLRIDVGRHRLGVRPGPDLSDLARGVGSLKGVRLAGLWLGDAAATAGVAALDEAALSHLLRRCRTSFARAGQEVSRISVPRLGGEPEIGATETREPIPPEGQEGLAIVAGVVGRPTRDQAVVDAGRRVLGDAVAVVGPPNHAEVTFIGQDFSVLMLDVDRQDLAIGDLVLLCSSAPIYPLSGQEVLVHMRGRWRKEPIF